MFRSSWIKISNNMLYKYCSSLGFDIIRNSRLKVAEINTINDPFEFAISINDQDSSLIVSDLFSDHRLISVWEEVFQEYRVNINFNQNPEEFVRKVFDFQVRDYTRNLRRIQNDMNNSTGLICLSNRFDVIPLWAHYGDKHQGIVIGIDESCLPIEPDGIIPVEYKDDLPKIKVRANIVQELDITPIVRAATMRKAKAWGYE